MKPISAMSKKGVIDKMFPHTYKLFYIISEIDYDLPPSQQVPTEREVLISEGVCSVQNCNSSLGEVVSNEYIILTPYFEYEITGDNADASIKLEVVKHGQTYTAERSSIQTIETNHIYDIGNTPIGGKIKVKLPANTWVW